jgi:hypothetical protein
MHPPPKKAGSPAVTSSETKWSREVWLRVLRSPRLQTGPSAGTPEARSGVPPVNDGHGRFGARSLRSGLRPPVEMTKRRPAALVEMTTENSALTKSSNVLSGGSLKPAGLGDGQPHDGAFSEKRSHLRPIVRQPARWCVIALARRPGRARRKSHRGGRGRSWTRGATARTARTGRRCAPGPRRPRPRCGRSPADSCREL